MCFFPISLFSVQPESVPQTGSMYFSYEYYIVTVNVNIQEYKPPAAKDIPQDFRVTLLKSSRNPVGVLSSKGTRESSRQQAAAEGTRELSRQGTGSSGRCTRVKQTGHRQ